MLHLENMRQGHLLLSTDDQTNKRALQFLADTASTSFVIADDFITLAMADTY